MIRYFQETMQILNHAVESIDIGMFSRLSESCAAVLRNGKRVIVSGLGKNVPVCEKFVGTMLSLGLDAGFMHSNSEINGDLGLVRDARTGRGIHAFQLRDSRRFGAGAGW